MAPKRSPRDGGTDAGGRAGHRTPAGGGTARVEGGGSGPELRAEEAREKEAVPHALGMPEETKEDLLRRLARARGQVEGIARMIEDERYCPDVLQQFTAVHSALKSAEKLLLANHLERCATSAIEEGGASAERVRREIIDLFGRQL